MGWGRVAEKRAVWRGVGGFCQDGFDIFDEAHAEHLVGFVEDDGLHSAEVQGVLLDEVQQATGRADDDVDAALEAPDLAAIGLPAVHRQDDRLQAGSVGFQGACHLQGELARGHQDQALDHAQTADEVVEDGQTESRGLAGAGLRLPDDILSCEQGGNDSRLNGGRLAVAEISDCLHQGGVQVEAVKSVRHQNTPID